MEKVFQDYLEALLAGAFVCTVLRMDLLHSRPYLFIFRTSTYEKSVALLPF